MEMNEYLIPECGTSTGIPPCTVIFGSAAPIHTDQPSGEAMTDPVNISLLLISLAITALAVFAIVKAGRGWR
jgi:hypothetical protein